jgi:translation initiation factor IF-1
MARSAVEFLPLAGKDSQYTRRLSCDVGMLPGLAIRGYTRAVQRGRRPPSRRRQRTTTEEKADLKDAVEMDGVITSSLSNGFYNVEIAGGHTVLARLAGKMTKGHIRVQVLDKVRVQMSVYDLTRGRIVWRFRD